MEMLSPTFNGILTATLLMLFIGIWVWSWSAKRKPDFERMANLPLEDDFLEADTASNVSKKETDKKDEESL